MCMEDYTLGRETVSRSGVFTVGTSPFGFLAASPKRTALILGAPLAGTLTYLDQPSVASGLGINVAAGQVPIVLNIQDHGEIIVHQWWVIADAAARTAGFIETNLAK